MLHKTKGLVLRAVKYGDTSLIVSIFTELFGVQSYIINGVRTSSPKQPYRANLFQPATLLDLVVYHNERSNLQRIKEFRWNLVYKDIYKNVHKNTVALFLIEVLQKCLTQPEANPDLFAFMEDVFSHLDDSDPNATANFPLYFMANLGQFFGFRIQDDYVAGNEILDLQEGGFVSERPMHPDFVEGLPCEQISQLLKTRHPDELDQLHLNREQRKLLLDVFISFYIFHHPGFGQLKSVAVLHALYES
ncbi:MAG TPA: DNA repair protein RecO [Chitinophagaceae bacterium]|nr:DNA repair protein RecO [Chitinophagaceae bacterium]